MDAAKVVAEDDSARPRFDSLFHSADAISYGALASRVGITACNHLKGAVPTIEAGKQADGGADGHVGVYAALVEALLDIGVDEGLIVYEDEGGGK